MSTFQFASAAATGVFAIGALAISMTSKPFNISDEILKFYESDYEFYQYLRENEERFTYSMNTYGRTIAISRMRANMMYERIHINEETQEQPQETQENNCNLGAKKNLHTREYYIEADIRNLKFRAGYKYTNA